MRHILPAILRVLVCPLTIFLSISFGASAASASTTIKVGVYQDFPLVFYDQQGKAHGVYVDLLDHIAIQEDWQIEYVPCKWVDCLSMLENGEIDLLTAIAFSKERTAKYDFNKETVFPNWGQVYTANGIKLDSIAELAGRTVAGLDQDIYFKSLRELTEKAGLEVSYQGADEYDQVFKLLEQQEVDAGILPRLYGDLNEKKFRVNKTTIIVRLSELRFAAKKSANQELLAAIDTHLHKLKEDNNSLYFQSVSRWLGQQDEGVDIDLDLSDPERKWLTEHRRILLGVDPEFVPFEFIDVDGSYRGMCADYVQLLSERTGIAMDIAPNLSWNEAVERAKIKAIDVLPCVGMTEKRKEFLTYSTPHQTFYRVFVTREGSTIGNGVDDLVGHSVAVQRNSSHHGFLQDNTTITPILFDTAEQAIISVSEGRNDVFVGNENMTGYTINRKGIVNLKMTRLEGAEGRNLYFAVRNDWPELVSIINKGLASISEKEREAIKQKWIAVTIEKQIDYTLVYQVGAAIFCFILIFSLWNAQIRRQRKKLRESERRYQALADNSEVGILQISPEGTSIYLNTAMTKMVEADSAEQVIGKNIIEFVAPPYRDLVQQERQKRSRNISSTYEVEFVGLKGTQKNVMISAAPIFNDAGKLESIISSIVDISALKQVENALRSAKNDAESANLAKSTFLANMSHELRTPLNAILGFSGLMMRDGNLSEDQLSSLESIGRSGEHLLDLINDVLEFSKIEAGRVELQPENFDLYRLLFVIEEMFSLRAVEKGLALTVQRADDVPQYIHGDQGKLRQTLINILGNAVKFTPQGSITLRVSREGTKLFFEVEDTGVGIAKEEMAMVFDVFVQSASGQESKQGSGLGIPISQKFVNMMGGELTVASEVGTGTTFRFDIELQEVDGADEAVSESVRKVMRLEHGQDAFRILVVEDNKLSRKLLVTLLTKVGFEVRDASDGQEAVELWKEWQPHLIWMDLRMPVLDGYEATERIRSLSTGSETYGDTKIIALTASAFEENKARAFASGCDDFVRKPFRESEIFTIMATQLGVRYVYGDDGEVPEQVVATELLNNSDLADQVAKLPEEIVARLAVAADLCDADRVDQIIDEIKSRNPAVAEALSRFSRKFDYDRIMKVLNNR